MLYFYIIIILFCSGVCDSTPPDPTVRQKCLWMLRATPLSATSPSCITMIIIYYYDSLNLNHWGPFDYLIGNSVFDTLKYTYNMPFLTPIGRFKSLEGDIRARLNTQPIYWPSPAHKRLKFYVHIRDRAGHWSNWVSTPVIERTNVTSAVRCQ